MSAGVWFWVIVLGSLGTALAVFIYYIIKGDE